MACLDRNEASRAFSVRESGLVGSGLRLFHIYADREGCYRNPCLPKLVTLSSLVEI